MSAGVSGALFNPNDWSQIRKGEWQEEDVAEGNENSQVADERQHLIAFSRVYIGRREETSKSSPLKGARGRRRRTKKSRRESEAKKRGGGILNAGARARGDFRAIHLLPQVRRCSRASFTVLLVADHPFLPDTVSSPRSFFYFTIESREKSNVRKRKKRRETRTR